MSASRGTLRGCRASRVLLPLGQPGRSRPRGCASVRARQECSACRNGAADDIEHNLGGALAWRRGAVTESLHHLLEGSALLGAGLLRAENFVNGLRQPLGRAILLEK